MGADRATHRERPVAARRALTAHAGALALLLALAASLLAARSAAAQAHAQAQAGDALAAVRAFDAAWNQRDLDAVVASFAPDAVVRQATTFASAGADHVVAADVYGARLLYAVGAQPFTVEGDRAVWRGRAAIRAWAAALFALRHRADASGFALVRGPGDWGDRGEADEGGARAADVAWRYRAHVDFFQTIPGVPPAEGTATATVGGSAITALTLDASGDARTRRDEAVGAALRAADARNAVAQSRAPAAAPVEPPAPAVVLQAPAWHDGAWPLALVALGAGAYALAVGRGRPRRH